jgi:hypothetical protein
MIDRKLFTFKGAMWNTGLWLSLGIVLWLFLFLFETEYTALENLIFCIGMCMVYNALDIVGRYFPPKTWSIVGGVFGMTVATWGILMEHVPAFREIAFWMSDLPPAHIRDPSIWGWWLNALLIVMFLICGAGLIYVLRKKETSKA